MMSEGHDSPPSKKDKLTTSLEEMNEQSTSAVREENKLKTSPIDSTTPEDADVPMDPDQGTSQVEQPPPVRERSPSLPNSPEMSSSSNSQNVVRDVKKVVKKVKTTLKKILKPSSSSSGSQPSLPSMLSSKAEFGVDGSRKRASSDDPKLAPECRKPALNNKVWPHDDLDWKVFIPEDNSIIEGRNSLEDMLALRCRVINEDFDAISVEDLARKMWCIVQMLRKTMPCVYPVMTRKQLLVLLYVLKFTDSMPIGVSLEPSIKFVDFIKNIWALKTVRAEEQNKIHPDLRQLCKMGCAKPERVFAARESLNNMLLRWYEHFNSKKAFIIKDPGARAPDFYWKLALCIAEKSSRTIAVKTEGVTSFIHPFAFSPDYIRELKLAENMQQHIRGLMEYDDTLSNVAASSTSVSPKSYSIQLLATDREKQSITRIFWQDFTAESPSTELVAEEDWWTVYDWQWTANCCARLPRNVVGLFAKVKKANEVKAIKAERKIRVADSAKVFGRDTPACEVAGGSANSNEFSALLSTQMLSLDFDSEVYNTSIMKQKVSTKVGKRALRVKFEDYIAPPEPSVRPESRSTCYSSEDDRSLAALSLYSSDEELAEGVTEYADLRQN